MPLLSLQLYSLLHYALTKDWCQNSSVQSFRTICSRTWERISCWKTCNWQVSNQHIVSVYFLTWDRYVKKCTKTANNRVTSVEPLSNRVEVTLKMSTAPNIPKSEIIDLSKFHVGDVVSGRIKRVESFGLFIAIDNTNMVFLQPLIFLPLLSLQLYSLLQCSQYGYQKFLIYGITQPR